MTIHLALAWVAAVLDGLVLALAVVGGLRHRMARFAIDRAILATEAGIALALVSGLFQLATTPGPRDPLHFVYALVALAALPAGRAWLGLGRGPRPWPLAIAGVIVLGVLVRLAQTG
jgi:hypothetical protein